MPFGKANSSKKFCAWTDLWFASVHHHFQRAVPFHSVLGSYVDDAFGGARTEDQALSMIDYIIQAGQATATHFNRAKTRGPATRLVVLGLLFCSVTQSCRVGADKLTKYLIRIDDLVAGPTTQSRLLEQLVGNLGFAAWVEPFCRPLLAILSRAIVRDDPAARVHLTKRMVAALRIWRIVLVRNRGLPYKFILNKLPAVPIPIYVDAATSSGCGGFHNREYFSFSHGIAQPYLCTCPGWETFPRVPIALLELLSAFVAVQLFAPRYPGHFIVLYSDNQNVVSWLGSRQPPNPAVAELVAAIDRIKYHYLIKLSARFIPSKRNRSADLLSRGVVPGWLSRLGTKVFPCMRALAYLINYNNSLRLWTNSVKSATSV